MAAAIPYLMIIIGQVQFPNAGAVLACLGEACQTALCVHPLLLVRHFPQILWRGKYATININEGHHSPACS